MNTSYPETALIRDLPRLIISNDYTEYDERWIKYEAFNYIGILPNRVAKLHVISVIIELLNDCPKEITDNLSEVKKYIDVFMGDYYKETGYEYRDHKWMKNQEELSFWKNEFSLESNAIRRDDN